MDYFVNEILENIWKDRYRKNGESLDENLKRVADYCSTSDSESLSFLKVMKHSLFFPAGRTMSNSGIGRDLTLNNCFVAGTKVFTSQGYKNIEDVKVGEFVLTENNSWQKVTNTMERNYEGDLFKISSTNLYDDICCTPNHKFLTQFGWKRADRLLFDSTRSNPVDKLKVPDITYEKKYENIDLLSYFEEISDKKIRFSEDKSKICIQCFCGKNRHNNHISWMKQNNYVNRYLEMTNDFRYLIGRWIGDGSITKYKNKQHHSIIQIVFNATKEREDALRCKKIGDKIFGFESSWQETKQNIIAVRWCSELLAEMFFKEFGEKCNTKFLSDKYLGDLDIAKGLIDSDGHIDTHGQGSISLKNLQLITWLRETLYLNGINTHKIRKSNKYEDTYSVSWSGSLANKKLNHELMKTFHDKAYNKITTNNLVLHYIYMNGIEIIENQKCKVYNLSVDNYHSYVVNGVVCHNCFTAPLIQDDLTDIFQKVALGAKTHQRGGGIGYNFSQLRPNGTPTSNDAVASGAVSFMDVFNSQTATILQGGRRGANMGLMSIYSMDIKDFITAKSYNEEKLNHFNVTVMVDDNFMKAVKEDKNIYLHHPVYDENGFIQEEESKWKYKKEIRAKELWDLIIQKAYDNGEPGIAFCDTMNKDNNLWYIENIVATNPCFEYLSGTVYGENPVTKEKLDPNEFGGACNLGSLFLHNFVKDPFTRNARLDYKLLNDGIITGVNFLDNIIDINKFPDEIYKNYQKNFRTIGLGITGLADMLVMLNMKYNSLQAKIFVDELMNYIALKTYQASIELAKKKGGFPFLNRERFVESGFIKKHCSQNNKYFEQWTHVREDILKYGIRNAKMLSVAPTGTLSLTYGNNCSSGLEPIFSLEYERKVKMGGQDDADIKIVKMCDYAYQLWNKTNDNLRIVQKDMFVTAMEMSVNAHLGILESVAKHVDMSVSKTINVPTDYSFEATKEIYMKCYESGIKGCTIFRPNKIRQGILSATNSDNISTKNEIEQEILGRGYIIKADNNTIGRKRKLITGCGSLHCTAFFDSYSGELLETYLSKGSTGGCNNFMIGLSRMISLAARGGIDIYSIIDQLNSCGSCPSYAVRSATKHDTSKGSCCPASVGNALLEMYNEIQDELNESIDTDDKQQPMDTIEKILCPECGEALVIEGGCNVCKSCGWSKCQ